MFPVVVFEVKRVVFFVVQEGAGIHVIGVVGVTLFGCPGVDKFGPVNAVLLDLFVIVIAGGGVHAGDVESAVEKFFGRCYAVAGLESVEDAEHGIVEEVGDGPAVAGHLAYDFGEFAVSGEFVVRKVFAGGG